MIYRFFCCTRWNVPHQSECHRLGQYGSTLCLCTKVGSMAWNAWHTVKFWLSGFVVFPKLWASVDTWRLRFQWWQTVGGDCGNRRISYDFFLFFWEGQVMHEWGVLQRSAENTEIDPRLGADGSCLNSREIPADFLRIPSSESYCQTVNRC